MPGLKGRQVQKVSTWAGLGGLGPGTKSTYSHGLVDLGRARGVLAG